MVESNSETVEVGRSDELKCNTKRGIKQEPSFSGWCDEDGVPQLRNDGLNEEDFDFMPLVQLQVLEIGDLDGEGLHSSDSRCRMENGGGSDGASSANGLGKKKEYVPFDIENGHDDKVYTNRIKDHVDYNETSRKKVNPVSVADVLKTLFFILVWYTLSTFLTLYNKTLLGDHMGKFPAPLLMNTIHFSMQAVLSKGITWFWSDRFQSSTMSWKDYFVRDGLFLSQLYRQLSAQQWILESPSLKLLGIITVISVGILLTVAKEADFEFWGFVFVMLASVMSGFRWTMTQILLQKETYGLKNPLTLMSYVTPIMAIATGLLSLILEPWHEFGKSDYFNSSGHILRSSLLMLFGGTLAYFMVLTEYVLVSVTSAVIVTIAGVVKEAVTILVAVLYFHDKFTWMKGVGLLTIMFGVSLFNWYKYDKLQKGETSVESPTENGASKYVILDEMDEEEDVPLNPNQ